MTGTTNNAKTAEPNRLRRTVQFLRRLGPAGPLLLVASTLPNVGAALLLGTLTLIAPTVRELPYAPVVCVVAFTILGGLSVLPTFALSILAGWCFGFAVGYPTSLAGILLAAVVAYAVARLAAGKRLLEIIDEKPSWRAVHHALVGRGFVRATWIVALMRLSPFPPYSIVNVVMGAAHVKPSRFVVGTVLGMAPQAGFLVLASAGLREMSFRVGNQPVLIAVGMIAMISMVVLVGRIAKKALESVARAEERMIAGEG